MVGHEVEDAHAKNNKITKPIDMTLQFIFPREEKYYRVFLVSVLLIAALSYVLVEVAVESAHFLNIPESIIALTVLDIGTSIPDLFSSIIVNCLGFNIFDILLGLGLPFLIVMSFSGGTIEAGGNLTKSSVILFASVIILAILLLTSRWKVGKRTGIFLLLLYIGYLAYEILNL